MNHTAPQGAELPNGLRADPADTGADTGADTADTGTETAGTGTADGEACAGKATGMGGVSSCKGAWRAARTWCAFCQCIQYVH